MNEKSLYIGARGRLAASSVWTFKEDVEKLIWDMTSYKPYMAERHTALYLCADASDWYVRLYETIALAFMCEHKSRRNWKKQYITHSLTGNPIMTLRASRLVGLLYLTIMDLSRYRAEDGTEDRTEVCQEMVSTVREIVELRDWISCYNGIKE